jgi:hypothetical protein
MSFPFSNSTNMKTNMKNILTMVASVAILFSLATLTACDKGPELTKEERATKLLTSGGGTWAPSATSRVTMDGIDVTDDFFSGFSITFAEGTFTTAGTSPMFLRDDTWTFKDKSATVIVRGQDQKEITIVELTKTKLVMTLEWDQTTYEDEGGRKRSLPGEYEFVLTK